jgi:hypothetical protein
MDGPQQGARVGFVPLGRIETGQFRVTKQVIVVANRSQGNFDALLYCRIRQPFGDAVAVGFIGKLLPDLSQRVLTIDILDVREQCHPLAHHRHPPHLP